MKRAAIYIILLLVFSDGILKAQKGNAAEINYKMSYEGESIQLNLFLSNLNFRLEKNSAEDKQVYLFAGGLSVVLYPALNIYAEYDDIKDELLNEKPPIAGFSDKPILTKTKIKENILGVECEKWILKNSFTSVEMYINRDIKFNPKILDLLPEYSVDWQETLKKEKALPLLVIIKDETGETIYRFEAYNIMLEAQDEALFRIPGNFDKKGKRK